MSVVKLAMSSKGYKLEDSDDSYLAYGGAYQELFSIYYFDSSQKLGEVLLAFLTSEVSVDAIREYMTTELGYSFVTANSDKTQFLYMTADQTSVAFVRTQEMQGTELSIVDYVSLSSLTSGAKRQIKSAGFFDWTTPQINGELFEKALDMKIHQLQSLEKSKVFNFIIPSDFTELQ